MYLIGKIVKPHGVKGEVKVLSHSDFDRFKVADEIIINNKILKIKSVRPQNELLLISFENKDSLNDVLELHGLDIYSNKEVKLKKDEFHLPKLIGLEVYTDDQLYVGTVKYVVDVPQGHLLEIYNKEEKKILIPFIKEFIKTVDEEKIIITPIEGLI